MSAKDQGSRKYGSQYWLQHMVNRDQDSLDAAIRNALALGKPGDIHWVSPLQKDGFREYKDSAFLEQLGLEHLKEELANFWPKGGPVWDGLARVGKNRYLLVEAKSHIQEVNSPACGAGEASAAKIDKTFEAVRVALKVAPSVPCWRQAFYQYTNRMAHLYFLRKHGAKAFLVNLYFCNDNREGVMAPASEAEWKPALFLMKLLLGLSHTRLSKYCADVFIDVTPYKQP